MSWIKRMVLAFCGWFDALLKGGRYDVVVCYKDLDGGIHTLCYVDDNGVSGAEYDQLLALNGKWVDRHKDQGCDNLLFLVDFFHFERLDHGIGVDLCHLNSRARRAAALTCELDERQMPYPEDDILFIGFKSDPPLGEQG